MTQLPVKDTSDAGTHFTDENGIENWHWTLVDDARGKVERFAWINPDTKSPVAAIFVKHGLTPAKGGLPSSVQLWFDLIPRVEIPDSARIIDEYMQDHHDIVPNLSSGGFYKGVHEEIGLTSPPKFYGLINKDHIFPEEMPLFLAKARDRLSILKQGDLLSEDHQIRDALLEAIEREMVNALRPPAPPEAEALPETRALSETKVLPNQRGTRRDRG